MFWRTVFCLCHMVKTNERVKKEDPVIWPSLNSVKSDNSSIIVLLTLTQLIFSLLFPTLFFAFSCHQPAFGYRLLFHCVKHLYCREKCSTSKHSCNSNTIFLLRKKKKKVFSHSFFSLLNSLHPSPSPHNSDLPFKYLLRQDSCCSPANVWGIMGGQGILVKTLQCSSVRGWWRAGREGNGG